MSTETEFNEAHNEHKPCEDFEVPSPSGETTILVCPACGFGRVKLGDEVVAWGDLKGLAPVDGGGKPLGQVIYDAYKQATGIARDELRQLLDEAAEAGDLPDGVTL